MRTVHILSVVAIATLLAPACSFAASKEQQEMQRDIAQLQDQVRTLQSGFDQKMATLQTLVQQALDVGNKANTSVSVLNASVGETLNRELRERLTPVAGLSAKLDNATNDMAELRNSVSDLNTQMNKVVQMLGDVNAAIKVIQSPAAAPPPPATGTMPGQPGLPGTASAAPPPASVIFTNAMSDYNGGKSDLAVSEFTDFLRFYPDDPNAATAQLFIGQTHYAQGKFDLAVRDFDAVLERFPENSKVTPTAHFEKGMALKQSGHRDAGVAEFRMLIKKYPNSDDAKQAREQLKSLGLSAGPAAAPVRRR